MQKQLVLSAAFTLIVIAGALPLVAMLAQTFIQEGALSLSGYSKVFATPASYLAPLARTLLLGLSTTTVAVLLGLLLGVLLEKTNLPLRRTWMIVFGAPLCVPPYIIAVGWTSLLSSTPAYLNWFYGLPGCICTLSCALTPIVMIVTVVALRAIDHRVEEAGRLITRWPGVLRHITLPLVQPALIFVGVIVLLLAAGELGVPLLLGYAVYPVSTLTQFAAFYDFAAASASAVPLLLLAALLMVLEQRSLRHRTPGLLALTPADRGRRIDLRHARYPAAMVVGTIALLLILLPSWALLQRSLSPFGYVRAWNAVGESILRSVAYASGGASVLTAVGFACGYAIQRRAVRYWRFVDLLSLILLTVPGPVVGLGLIALWNHTSTALLYGSAGMIIIAYVAQYNALSTRIVAASLAQLPNSLEDAACIAGAPWLDRLRYILMPMLRPGLIAGWLIAFIFCLRDLGASQLVYPPGAEPMTVRIFTLMANGSPSMVAAACVMLSGINLGMLMVLLTWFRMTRRSR